MTVNSLDNPAETRRSSHRLVQDVLSGFSGQQHTYLSNATLCDLACSGIKQSVVSGDPTPQDSETDDATLQWLIESGPWSTPGFIGDYWDGETRDCVVD